MASGSTGARMAHSRSLSSLSSVGEGGEAARGSERHSAPPMQGMDLLPYPISQRDSLQSPRRPSTAFRSTCLLLASAQARRLYVQPLNHWPEALDACERAAALHPDYAGTWAIKGNALSCLKRYTEALSAYEKALAIDPKDAVAWTGKGDQLNFLERCAGALAAYDTAISLNPNSARTLRNKAVALRYLGRIPEAEAVEQRAKELGG